MWPTRYSWASGAFIDVRTMGALVDVTYEHDSDSDSDPDGRIGDDFHAERSVHTSAASRGTHGGYGRISGWF